MAAKRLYLVDASTYIFRAFFAVRSLTNADGTPVNAVYGFTSMLLKLLRDEQPDYIAVVFDKSGHTFRNDIYPDYKANRPPPPEDLVPQFSLIREVTRAFNLPAIELQSYEADDIIGTLTGLRADEDVEVVVVSSDKDLMQLVGDGCVMLDTMRNVRYGPAEVHEKVGVRPDQIIDYLALMGDSVDNIPGVPGIGKKTAAMLLAQYGSLDGVYEHIDDIKGKRRENLEEFREQAYLSQTLATVHLEVPVDVKLEDLALVEPDRATLTAFFSRMGFKTWHREFHDADGAETAEDAAPSPKLGRDGFRLVRTEAELQQLASILRVAPTIAFDTETTGLDPRRASLVGLSFATDTVHAWYVPVGHMTLDADPQLSKERVLEVLGPILEDPTRPKAAHNTKYDRHVLRKEGVHLRGPIFDTMLASYVADAGRYRHSLDNVALDRLNHKTITFSEVAGSGKGQVTFDQVPVATARDYACEDAQLVLALKGGLEEEMDALGVTHVFQDVEIPLESVLADMEHTGVAIDCERLADLSVELGRRAAEMEKRCHDIAGEPFNLGSTKQLAVILFERMGLKPIKKTKTGFSTDSSVLEQLADKHELPAVILAWRSVTKLKSTYADVLPTLVNPDTGRIHTSFNQAVAATGRLSSADPNLQNIPVRTEDGRRIRAAFVAPGGHVLLSADYSQIELRVLAHLSGDAAMQKAFCDGADIHRRTAAELFGAFEEMVSREQRNVAKTINFGILYGMSAFRLAREQGMPRRDAQAIIDRYFARYPGIQTWKDRTLAEALDTGRVSTMLGRIRRIPDIKSASQMARRAAERVAINTPVQGTAADIIKLAMVELHPRLTAEMPEAKMVLQVHDELVFEVPSDGVGDLASLVTEVMEGVVELDVPLVVNASWGDTWLEAH